MLAADKNVRVVLSDNARLDGLTGGHTHQGVVARVSAQMRHVTLDDVLDGLTEPALILVLDGITDPHNLGACLRVADAAGDDHVGAAERTIALEFCDEAAIDQPARVGRQRRFEEAEHVVLALVRRHHLPAPKPAAPCPIR